MKLTVYMMPLKCIDEYVYENYEYVCVVVAVSWNG